ncbi:coiled-coil domain-containing protein 34 isoform X2 [Ascaphus truei]|uniref:coiled-coil domain-containing protein 34 isoform X2 n=1 Tax=Ascaphus truei TaxID=8439 RepID=UPI003F599EE8
MKSDMSSSQSGERCAGVRDSQLTSQGQAKERTKHCKGYDLSSSDDSTISLLSPIYHDSFESDDEDNSFNPRKLTEVSESRKARVQDSPEKERHSETEDHSLPDMNLTPWEEWLLCKEKKGRVELQRKVLEELKQEEEKLKQQQRKEMKKLRAEEQLKNWVQKKNEQERKEKEDQLLKEQKEKETQELEKATIQEKGKEKYYEWLRRKKEEVQQKKRREKEEAEKCLAEQKEKQEKANKMFEEWLENAKGKARPTSHSYGSVNGKLTGYYDGSSYPAPGFYNPIPWKPIHVPQPPKEAANNLSAKKKKRAASSQPYKPNLGSLYKPKDNLRVGGGMLKR